MANEFKLDLSKVMQALTTSPASIVSGSKKTMNAVKDDWLEGSRNLAPIAPDGGNLRAEMESKVEGSGLNGAVIVTANATNESEGYGSFNYGYYIHEHDAGGKPLKSPGTKKKFLEAYAEDNLDKWQDWFEKDVAAAFKKAGW